MPRTAISHAALFDELIKIGEAAEQKLTEEPPPKRKWVGPVTRDILLGGAGMGTGLGIGQLMSRTLLKRSPSAQTVKWTLPILGGAAFILGDRYRRLMDESHRQAPGWPAKK